MDKPWLSRYPSDVPETINPDQYPSLIEMFEQSVQKYADQPAFENMGSIMTFRKLEERSRAFAAYLQNDLKLKKGDRVAPSPRYYRNLRFHHHAPPHWKLLKSCCANDYR